ncbi:hypothetical protein FRC03_001156 [Tulasnella sp. 419]|nr:hypothetical protein FRC03_001156 [Tulasnella sp. 419]
MSKKPADLYEAIRCLENAVTNGFPSMMDLLDCKCDLALAHWSLFRQEGKRKVLDQSIKYWELALPGITYQGQIKALSFLVVALGDRYRINGNIEDLDRGILYCKGALLHLPSTHAHRAAHLESLAACLELRFHILGIYHDLYEGIICGREALSLISAGDPPRPGLLYSLASSLALRYKRTEWIEDLEASIGHLHECLALTPASDTHRSSRLSDMSGVLVIKYKRFRDLSNLSYAIECLQEVARLESDSHAVRAATLSSLGSCLRDKYELSNDVNELEEAAKCHPEALSILPEAHPQTADHMRDLALVYLTYNTIEHSDLLLEQAKELLRKAVSHPQAAWHTKFNASLQLAPVLEGIQRLEAYQMSLRLADRCISVSASITARHESLQSFLPGNLASEAVAYAIETGHLEKAVELLEQGRTILWSQMQRHRTLDLLRL